MGADWDNSKWVGPWMDKAAEIIRNNRSHFELTMHGVGHEYWTAANSRAPNGPTATAPCARSTRWRPTWTPTPRCWSRTNSGLSPPPGSRAPSTRLRSDRGPQESAAEVVNKRGIVYINTPWGNLHNREAVQYGMFGFDAGVITVDRGPDTLPWQAIGAPPKRPVRGPTCGMHWPNVLHPDPQRNSETVENWVRFLRPFNDRVDAMLAPDSLFFRNQLVHSVCTPLTVADRTIRLDFTKVDGMPGTLGRQELTLRIKSPAPCSLHPPASRSPPRKPRRRKASCCPPSVWSASPGGDRPS